MTSDLAIVDRPPFEKWRHALSARGPLLTLVTLGGLALFVRSLHSLGWDQILASLLRVGWGFALIVLVAGAREALRALAWTQTIDGAARLGFAAAFRARLVGEAFSALLPMGILVGEPAKAVHVGRIVPFAPAFAGLALEFFFYSLSLLFLLAAGAIALSATTTLGDYVRWTHLAAPAIAGAALIGIGAFVITRRASVRSAGTSVPAESVIVVTGTKVPALRTRVPALRTKSAFQNSGAGFAGPGPPEGGPHDSADTHDTSDMFTTIVGSAFRRTSRLTAGPDEFEMHSQVPVLRSKVVALRTKASAAWQRLRAAAIGVARRPARQLAGVFTLELAFQVLAVAEVYITLWLISPVPPTIASAIVLETVGRLVTMAFKYLPMRVGVDEAGAAWFAGLLHLGSQTGVTLAIVRKLRLLFWSGVGLALLGRERSTRWLPA